MKLAKNITKRSFTLKLLCSMEYFIKYLCYLSLKTSYTSLPLVYCVQNENEAPKGSAVVNDDVEEISRTNWEAVIMADLK